MTIDEIKELKPEEIFNINIGMDRKLTIINKV